MRNVYANTLRSLSTRSALFVLAGAFVVSRILFAVMGVHQIGSVQSISAAIAQAIAPQLLRQHFLQSIFYLQSQPPLYNLELGVLLNLPHGFASPTVFCIDLALGFAFVSGTFMLLRELEVPNWLSLVCAIVVAFSPATILYEDWLFYTYPTAVLMTWSTFFCVRFIRTRTVGSAAAFFVGVSAVVLLNSSFQWPWLIIVSAIVVLLSRKNLRPVLTIGTIAFVVVGGWYLKNAVIFGSYTTSSWLGMNFAKITIVPSVPLTSPPVPPTSVRNLVESGKLSHVALIYPFSNLNTYRSALGKNSLHVDRSLRGVPVVDDDTKGPHGLPNYNNQEYIAISSRYLKDDIAFIKNDPSQYAKNVGYAIQLWFEPSDQYAFVLPNRMRIDSYAAAYDKVVDWQPTRPSDKTLDTVYWTASAGQISYRVLITYLVAFVGIPVVVWWERRRRPWIVAGLGFIWVSTCYLFLASNLLELGENNRFRVDLGVLPTVGAIVVIVSVVERLRRARSPHDQKVSPVA